MSFGLDWFVKTIELHLTTTPQNTAGDRRRPVLLPGRTVSFFAESFGVEFRAPRCVGSRVPRLRGRRCRAPVASAWSRRSSNIGRNMCPNRKWWDEQTLA